MIKEIQRPKVLLVDDEENILLTTSAILDDDFDVLTASSGAEALEILRRTDVDVVCSDYNMPAMNGIELLRTAVAQQPHLSLILITGYAEFLDKSEKRDGDRYLLLIKPYEPQALIDLILKAYKFSSVKRAMRRAS